MSKHTRDRSKESIEVKEHLYDLGLLNRPRGDSDPAKSPSRTSGKSHTRKAQKETSESRSGSSLGLDRSRSFKQSSITTGTLSRRHIPQHQTTRSSQHTDRPPSRAVAFAPEAHKKLRPQRSMGSMLNADRSLSRRERTFVGGACAACEELLEHTLRGERVLQFSCGHVAHEACFYEYIKDSDSQYCPTCDAPLALDSARGGSILDLSKLSNMVRSIAQQTEVVSPRSAAPTPMPWDRNANKEDGVSVNDMQSRASVREHNREHRDSRDSQRMRIERLGFVNQHSRNNSANAPSAEYPSQDSATHGGRKHDYDVHAMETTVVNPTPKEHRNTIPSPMVTVRSEFPTLTRSQQQQSLTCLVTIEVPEAKWISRRDGSQPASYSHHAQSSPPLPTSHSMPRSAPRPAFVPSESPEVLEEITEELRARVDNWHGLDFEGFGPLQLHGLVLVSKDRHSWQELECYLYGDRLICVKEKKSGLPHVVNEAGRRMTRCTLKGSIFVKKQLRQVQSNVDERILTLNLSVSELPAFHLQFQNTTDLENWKLALLDLYQPEHLLVPQQEYEPDTSGTDDDDYSRQSRQLHRGSSVGSSYGRPKSATTAATEYSNKVFTDRRLPPSLHVPLDIVVVIPVSSSMQGLKITLLKDTLRFMVNSLGDRDRMGLVTFGSSQGGVPLVGMTTKKWTGWNKVLNSIRPVGQKSLRADVVEGANVAMDLLMQRKAANPISTILLISDSSISESESVSFVVQRAEAAKIGIYSFGLGLTHKPDSMIELSSRTKASYLYVKDWMMLRECAAGCLGSLQSISHQNAKLKLKLPEGSPARFVKISGALQTTKRATGRDAEATLGDLRFGDKRDILVQLAIHPDHSNQEHMPQDHWESIVSGLEALGGSLESDEQRVQSIEEVPLLQADLSYSDVQSNGTSAQLSRPSLLTITMLPASRRSKNGRPSTPPIPSHPSIVQRRMELLTSDMLTRALTLASRGQADRAHHLLVETRSILKGLAKGGLPPLPPGATAGTLKHSSVSVQPKMMDGSGSVTPDPYRSHTPESDNNTTPVPRSSNLDPGTMDSLDADIESSLEWINHPAVFSRDSRKAVLQAIGTISSQRGYTFRTPSEALWAERINGIRRLTDAAREWRETGDEALPEET